MPGHSLAMERPVIAKRIEQQGRKRLRQGDWDKRRMTDYTPTRVLSGPLAATPACGGGLDPPFDRLKLRAVPDVIM